MFVNHDDSGKNFNHDNLNNDNLKVADESESSLMIVQVSFMNTINVCIIFLA